MMGNPQNIKLIYAYTIEKIFENLEYDENIFYVLIAYLTNYKDEFSKYIQASSEPLEINGNEIKEYSIDKKLYLEIFNKVSKKYELKNINKFKNSLYEYFKKEFSLNSDLKELLIG